MLRAIAHPVACYYMLLRVVRSCYISLHTTANTDAATPLPTLLTQQCWELLLRPFARSFSDQLRQNFPQRQGVYLDECFLLLLFCFPFCLLKPNVNIEELTKWILVTVTVVKCRHRRNGLLRFLILIALFP